MVMTTEFRARAERAAMLRKNGESFNAIGESLGVTRERARQILKRYERGQRRGEGYMPEWMDSLSTNVRHALLGAGIETREQAIEAITSGTSIDRVGPKGMGTVRALLGMLPAPRRDASPKAIQRAIVLLERNGYSVKKRG